MPPEVCPNCGALVPHQVKACPSCGSDEETGWSDSAHADNLGIPDEAFSHAAFVKDEFGGRTKPRGLHWFWWLTALLLILLFLLLH